MYAVASHSILAARDLNQASQFQRLLDDTVVEVKIMLLFLNLVIFLAFSVKDILMKINVDAFANDMHCWNIHVT